MLTANNFTCVNCIRKQLEDDLFILQFDIDLLFNEVLDIIAHREEQDEYFGAYRNCD